MRKIMTIGILSITSLLTACDTGRQILGFNRTENDEFAVATTTRRLEMPHDFNSLPDPVAPYTRNVADQLSTNKARDIALGQLSDNEQAPPIEQGSLEHELLQKAQAKDRDPQIRKTVEEEAKLENYKAKSFIK